ncbi:uncharacterized serine-rich protein C215.13-like [Dendronephthya gigantea]|uniref:uncharacterized serine-rich protein C215.13-like n=1 Tax=Dendronephthya gigantea TaxID=151771 RepID=UPI00106A8EEA|nr:uncharacterized serine-rich protein C215.13-like [Dendronephthya gigantea]
MKQSATLATPSTVPSLSSSAAVSSSLYYELTSSISNMTLTTRTLVKIEKSSTLVRKSTVADPSSSSSSKVNTSSIYYAPSLPETNVVVGQSSPTATSSIARASSSSYSRTSIRVDQSSATVATSTVVGQSSSAIYSSSTFYHLTPSFPAISLARTSSPPLTSSVTTTVAKLPSPSSQTSAMTQESSSSSAILTTSLPRSLMYRGSTEKLEITSDMQPTPTSKVVSTMSSTQLTPTRIVALQARILNIEFVASYQDKDSIDCKKLRDMLEKAVINIFDKISGFLRISDVDFDEGSVIANIQTEFSSESKQVSSSSLARAVVDASDEKGNLDELHFDKSFLEQQVVSTTPKATVGTPSKDEEDEGDKNAMIGATAAIGTAGFICLVLILFFVCYFKKQRNEQKNSMKRPVRIELYDAGSYENHHFDAWYEE